MLFNALWLALQWLTQRNEWRKKFSLPLSPINMLEENVTDSIEGNRFRSPLHFLFNELRLFGPFLLENSPVWKDSFYSMQKNKPEDQRACYTSSFCHSSLLLQMHSSTSYTARSNWNTWKSQKQSHWEKVVDKAGINFPLLPLPCFSALLLPIPSCMWCLPSPLQDFSKPSVTILHARLLFARSSGLRSSHSS